ncbi:MAG TPA: BadF/BadG/BcrA/BcrD ATPase family protein [Gemmatimonadales bacterium]|jgi:glucosamine kinase|nr:BadF/BadG/BcrA/BcrD ATPase family protein [Gemmatimonadales bacterium]
MSKYVGVDAGGSKTSVLLADGEKVIARTTGAPGAVRPGRALQAASRIAAAVRRALTEANLLEADVLVVGAAGVGRDPERSELREGLRGERLATRTLVTGDLDIALEAGFGSGPGIVLLSGTGSVAAARTAEGVVHRRGGYGWQMGDEGSGYAIGRAALIAAGRANDGRGAATSLIDALLAQGPAREFAELVRWSSAAEAGEVAALAPLVFSAAAAGDAIARTIVESAAEELAGMVSSLLPLFGGKGRVEVAIAGGNLEPKRGLRAPLLARLRKTARLSIREAPLDPAAGALALARRQS